MAKNPAQSGEQRAADKDAEAKAKADAEKANAETKSSAKPEFLTFNEELPTGLSAEQLAKVQVVVKAKSATGRRRAGFQFTRDETVIALAELKDEQLASLRADPELIVATRVPTGN